MMLNYMNETILNEDGIQCQVLDTTAIDFSESKLGRKSAETIVLKANGGEKINTINSSGYVESTYIANPGDAIFYNNERDIYVPRDSNGVAWQFDNIQSYGYEISESQFTQGSNIAIKVKSTKTAKILPEIISKPTCIKDAWGKGQHQFLFEGATLKQDLDTGKVTGIDKDAFNKTWEIVPKILVGTIKKARFEVDDYNSFIVQIDLCSNNTMYKLNAYSKYPFFPVLDAIGELLKRFEKKRLEDLEGMEIKFIEEPYIRSVARLDDREFFSFDNYYEEQKRNISAKAIKKYIDYMVVQCRNKGGKETFCDAVVTLAERFEVEGDIDDVIFNSFEKIKGAYSNQEINTSTGFHK